MVTELLIKVVLNGPENWPLWFSQVRNYAIMRDLWDTYVNPDIPIEPKRPSRPVRPSVKTIDPNAADSTQLNDNQRELWRDLRWDYELDLKEYAHINDTILGVYKQILASISLTNMKLTQNKTSCWQILRLLKEKYAPSEQYEYALAKRSKYLNL